MCWFCRQGATNGTGPSPWAAPASGGFCSCSGCIRRCGLPLIRGNVQTRLRKLDEGRYGAIVLAAAGLKRLGLEDRISRYFSPGGDASCGGPGHSGGAGPGGRGLRLLTWIFLTRQWYLRPG